MSGEENRGQLAARYQIHPNQIQARRKPELGDILTIVIGIVALFFLGVHLDWGA